MKDARVEIETVDELLAHVAGGGTLAGCVFQGLDLRGQAELLAQADLTGACFLGCELDPAALAHAWSSGALLFPAIRDVPFRPYRGALYDVDELYGAYEPGRPGAYDETLDARVYRHFVGRRAAGDILETLAERLHDHAITDALQELLRSRRHPRKVVGVMGGHELARGAPDYLKVARIAATLTRAGFFVATGGGPGAMEAANLGAYMARRPERELEHAVDMLRAAPHYDPKEAWLDQAFRVRRQYPLPPGAPDGAESLAIPTWHYGHEPPNAFATHVAKYFENSVREEGLLAIATYGVVYTPGSAGTVQEIFQDACQNHYEVFGVSPMIFLGETFWQSQKPVFPLLATLAAGRRYARWLAITDDAGRVVELVQAYAAERERETAR